MRPPCFFPPSAPVTSTLSEFRFMPVSSPPPLPHLVKNVFEHLKKLQKNFAREVLVIDLAFIQHTNTFKNLWLNCWCVSWILLDEGKQHKICIKTQIFDRNFGLHQAMEWKWREKKVREGRRKRRMRGRSLSESERLRDRERVNRDVYPDAFL